jgi:RHS repeat-associated protein
VFYLHADHLGSTSLATNETGGFVSRVLYYPYGETRYAEGTLPTDRLYTGQRWEQDFGLYDYHARYYNPALGRFISADTIVPSPANPQDLNRYAYVRNNPLKYTDPSGHMVDPGGGWGVPWLPPPPPTPVPEPVPTPPPPATPTPTPFPAETVGVPGSGINPVAPLGFAYDAHRAVMSGAVEYGVPEVYNALKLPNRAYMGTLANGGHVIYGYRAGSWSVSDSRILIRSCPSIVAGIGDAIGAGIVVWQNVHDYTRGYKQNAHPGEMYVSTGLDLMGYGTANLLGEFAGIGAAALTAPSGPGALVAYAGVNLVTQVAVQETWDALVTQPALEVFRESHPYP